jgi:hypothetical protein
MIAEPVAAGPQVKFRDEIPSALLLGPRFRGDDTPFTKQPYLSAYAPARAITNKESKPDPR